MAKRKRSYFNNLADIKTILLLLILLFPGTHQTMIGSERSTEHRQRTGTHQTMIGSEKSTEHRQRNEKICRTHR